MTNETKNIFISHVHEDDAGISNLKGLLAPTGLTVRDGSISSDKPNQATNEEYIKNEILAPRIRWASTLVVYITPATKESDWVNWEIEYAQKQNKRIVGVWAHGAAEADLPEALDDYHDALVGWNSERIVDAILGAADESTGPTGNERESRPISRAVC